MKRYWTLFFGLLGLLLLVFVFAQWAGLDLDDIWRQLGGLPAYLVALIGVGLLVIDVLLPVPSILVIMGLGHLFGVILGATLSLVGMVLACLLAFGIGRGSRARLERWVGPDEQVKADALLGRWGSTAIIISRPLPLLAEAVAMMAGASVMGWVAVTRAAVIGSAPVCLVYAATGAGMEHLNHTWLVFATVLCFAVLSWFVGRRLEESISESP